MASLATSSQSTLARLSPNSFLCFTGKLVNVVVAVRFSRINEGVYTWVLKIVTDVQTDSLTAPTLTLSGQCHYGLLMYYYLSIPNTYNYKYMYMYTNTIPPICTHTFTHTHTYTYLQERNRMNFKENVWMSCIKKLTRPNNSPAL